MAPLRGKGVIQLTVEVGVRRPRVMRVGVLPLGRMEVEVDIRRIIRTRAGADHRRRGEGGSRRIGIRYSGSC